MGCHAYIPTNPLQNPRQLFSLKPVVSISVADLFRRSSAKANLTWRNLCHASPECRVEPRGKGKTLVFLNNGVEHYSEQPSNFSGVGRLFINLEQNTLSQTKNTVKG